MAKGFFQKIADLLSGAPQDKVAETPVEQKAEVAPVPSEVEEPAEEKPVKRVRRSDKPKSAEAETTEEVVKKPATRKRTAKSSVEAEAEPKPAPRRKAAAKSTEESVATVVETPAVAEHKSLGKNIIEKEANLIRLIITKLKENSDGNTSFDRKELTLFVADDLFFDALQDNRFEDSLIAKLDEQLGVSFAAVKLCLGKPYRDMLTTEIAENIFLHIKSNKVTSTIRRAVIYSVEGNGSLIESCYHLDSEEIKTLPMARYNIGRGSQPNMGVGPRRVNQIAIDDDPNCAGAGQNKYVSRAHAYITYSDKGGFILHLEQGGSRAVGKRTHVYRGGVPMELLSTMIPMPLKDGDYIVLSKFVHLLFSQED